MLVTFGPSGGDLRLLRALCPAGGLGAVTGHTVVGDRVVLNVGFHAARTRLTVLAADGMLLRGSEVAYGEGITALVELAGPAASLTRLADVCTEELTQADDCAHVALQWEAIGADGELFTALLADLMLVPVGDQITALSLAGACWPPPGRAGAGLDQVIARCYATAMIGSFLDSVARALGHLAGTEGTAGTAGHTPLPDHGSQPFEH